MFDKAQITIGAVGTGRRSWNLPGSYQIAGLTIDNPSGSWLFIPADRTFIPPYVLGFAHSFAPTLASIDILFANGPAGEVSTQKGDPPVAIIYDKPVAESAGVVSSTGASFITGFTPVQAISTVNSVSVSIGLSATLVAAIANRRFRLLTVSARAISNNWDSGIVGPGPVIVGDVGVDYLIADSFTISQVSLSGRIDRRNPSEFKGFSSGIDFPVGNPIVLVATTDPWADALLGLDITFQTI
jgi:hypothetical protein